jgi:signal peptidase I
MKTLILVIILFVSVFAFWFGLKFVFQTEYPLLAVASGSMTPTLNVGDLILVQGISNACEVNAAPYPKGDIIVFHKPGLKNELIVHRAVSKVENNGIWYFQTKGDDNTSYDHWSGPETWEGSISEKLLVGKVVGKAPWLGHIPLFMRTPSGILIIVFLFVILVIMDFVFPKKKDEKIEGREETPSQTE